MAKLLSGTRVYGTATVDTNLSVGANCSFNSGFGSAAVAYGCRAWVNFNGTGTPAIRTSGNVTSLTDNGVGDYTINLTSAMPDTNYAVHGTSDGAGGASYITVYGGATPYVVTSIRINVTTGAANVDRTYVNVSILR